MAADFKQTVIAGALAFGLVYFGGKIGGMVMDANHERAHQAGWAFKDWIGGGWEGFRSRMDQWTKEEAARRQAQRGQHRRRKHEPKPVSPDPLRFTLGPKRVYDPPRNAAELKRDKAQALSDYTTYGYGASVGGKGTEAYFFAGFEATDPRGVRGAMGKLVLRDATGKALWVNRWHYPSMGNPATLTPGYTRYEMVGEVTSNRPDAEYQAILALPAGEARLEWTPYFVAYADGTVAGDLDAPIDGEGLAIWEVGNGYQQLVRMRDEAGRRAR